MYPQQYCYSQSIVHVISSFADPEDTWMTNTSGAEPVELVGLRTGRLYILKIHAVSYSRDGTERFLSDPIIVESPAVIGISKCRERQNFVASKGKVGRGAAIAQWLNAGIQVKLGGSFSTVVKCWTTG